MTRRLQDAFKQQKKSTSRRVPQIYGTLGIPIGGKKTVEVPSRKTYVYVRLRNNQSEVIQAYNNQVAPAYNLPVIVERQGNRYSVVAVDTQRYENNWTSFAPFLPRHGNTHAFDIESGGAGDIVFVHPRQFMPALIIPSGSVGGPNVIMSSYTLKNNDGTWKYVGNTGTANINTYNPSSPTGAVMVLVYLDTESGNPSLLVGSGTVFSSALTGTSQITPYIPTVALPTTQVPLAAIRLVSGSSNLVWDNIYDVRQFVHNVPSGTGGSQATGTSVNIWDEGISKGSVTTLNVVGTVADISVSGSVARLFVTGTTGSSFTGLSGSVALLDATGQLTSQAGLKWGLSGGKVYLEFGADQVKEANAGRIGYQLFDSFFNIVGAGTSGGGDRWVKVYDALNAGLLQGGNIQNTNLVSSWVYHNATGTEVAPTNATEKTAPVGADQLLGLNSESSYSSIRMTIDSTAGVLLPSYISGLDIDYTTSGSLTVNPGGAYVPDAHKIVYVTGAITSSFTPTATNTSGTWQHVYLYSSGGAAAIEVSTTLPSNPYSGVARTKIGNTGMRYLGSLYCDAGGYLHKFTSAVHGNILKMDWLVSNFAFPFRVATGLASDTPVTLPITHLVPVVGAFNGLLAQLVLTLGASGDMNAAIGNSIPSELSSPSTAGEINIRMPNANAGASATVFLPATEMKLTGNSIQYATLQNAGSSTLQIRVRGVNIQR